MRVRFTLIPFAFLIAGVWATSAAAQQPCKAEMGLLEATNRAADFVGNKDFVAAITTCYEPFYKQYFQENPKAEKNNNTIDRFLNEYIDACVQASENQRLGPVLKKKYLETVIDLAQEYFEIFSGQQKPMRERAQTVVSNLIFASINLKRQPELLDTLGRIGAAFPEAFRPKLLNEWEKLLRSDSEFSRELADQEIRDRLQKDQPFQDNWNAYKTFLLAYRRDPQMRNEAQRRLDRLANLTKT